MQVEKLRIAEDNGLVPAGAYFKRVAAELAKTNTTEATRRKDLHTKERELEPLRRSPSVSHEHLH